MIRIFLALVLIAAIGSCKKIKEKVEEKQAMQFITIGRWKITNLTESSVDRSGEFANYTFQFHDNYTVDAFKTSTKEITGVWSGSSVGSSVTIMSNFPSNASAHLLLLNGTFNVTDADLNYVEATKTEAGVVISLRMEKVR